MTDMSVADVLRRAIDVLEQRGWCQNQVVGDNGEVCLLGAIQAAAKGSPKEYMLVATVPAAVREHLHREYLTTWIASWNDHPDRTYEDVVLALKHAAVDAEVQS